MRPLLSRLAIVATALALALTAHAKTGWSEDSPKSLADAKAGNKLVLLDFTGSDWCPWCIKMDKEVFEKPEFKEYAHQNLVLVEVDFPNAKKLTAHVKKQNDELKEQFKVSGYPTL